MWNFQNKFNKILCGFLIPLVDIYTKVPPWTHGRDSTSEYAIIKFMSTKDSPQPHGSDGTPCIRSLSLSLTAVVTLYRMSHLLMHLGWVDLNFECYTVSNTAWPDGNLAEAAELCSWAIWWNTQTSQPNPGPRAHGTSCICPLSYLLPCCPSFRRGPSASPRCG